MIEYRQDRFDTEHLGCAAFKLWLPEGAADSAELAATIDASGAEAVFCFAAHTTENIELLQRLGFNLISIRQTYELCLPTAVPNIPPVPGGIELLRLSDGLPPIRDEDLACLAEVIGATSRYFKDAHIARDRCRAVYVAWLSNSLRHGYADEAILAMRGEAWVGVHTLKIKNGTGAVDLIGVRPDSQGAGLGHALLQHGMAELHRRGMRSVQVVTEGENIGASRFYQRHGFLLRATELVWHKHI
jgi:ribosomal protein S18 acetylase RimI-like enzyme